MPWSSKKLPTSSDNPIGPYNTIFSPHRFAKFGKRWEPFLVVDFNGSSMKDAVASSSSPGSPNKALVRYVNSGFTFPVNLKSPVLTKVSGESK